MASIVRCILAAVLFLAAAFPCAAAAQTAPAYSAGQIDQIVAPIALEPDPLLEQIFEAASHPSQIVAAAQWRQNPAIAGLDGAALDQALQQEPWDPGVKTLTAFPELLAAMSSHIEWVQQLGAVFANQQDDTIDAIQQLRRQAWQAGHLQSNSMDVVSEQDGAIAIEPADPSYIAASSYDPAIMYGAWPYPAYPPYSLIAPGLPVAQAMVNIEVVRPFWSRRRIEWRHRAVGHDGHAPAKGAPPAAPSHRPHAQPASSSPHLREHETHAPVPVRQNVPHVGSRPAPHIERTPAPANKENAAP